VFTPFWRTATEQLSLPGPVDGPAVLPSPPAAPGGLSLDALGLAPHPGWDRGFWTEWKPGEAGARAELASFVRDAIEAYPHARERPGRRGTSRLSPHLHFGELAPWRVVHALHPAATTPGAEAFLRQLGWREFAHHVLHHFPATPGHNFNPRFDGFEWADVPERDLDAWRHGMTGIPIVDAGMRELWATGWMHNRVRMIVASFLTKNLRAHWSVGARWFWDTLVDADLANNTLGWQWVAGTGVDAAPYFRVFNPVSQSRRFDPGGEYIARWVPELAQLPAALRSEPWSDPALSARELNGYPSRPMVDVASSRAAALQAYTELRRT
jgi:deoxyribodipyrimidine photo-lyase